MATDNSSMKSMEEILKAIEILKANEKNLREHLRCQKQQPSGY